MHHLQSWITDFASQHKSWLGPTLKITLALAAAWLLHVALERVNPRWRRLVWRATTIGCVLITLFAVFPPPVAWHVLPPPSIEPADDLGTDLVIGEAAAGEQSSTAPTEPIVAFTAAPEEPATPESFCPRYNPAEYYPVPRAIVMGRAEPVAESAIEPAPAPIEPAIAEPAPIVVAADLADTTDQPDIADQPAAEPVTFATLLFNGKFWLAVWSLGALWKLIDTLLGMQRLRAICRRGRPVPAWIAQRARDMAAELGCHRTPELVATDEIGSPCIMGVWRPVVLLPGVQCEKRFRHELPAILFHELAHLRGQDVAWQLVVHALAIVWWFHPLAWRIRLAHASACDAVCDSVAAHHLGDAIAYGRILARLTIRILTLRAASGMAMAQSSSVRRRIEALERRIFPASLARGPAWCVVVLIVSLSALVGGITLARASANSSTPPDEIAASDDPASESAGDDAATSESTASETISNDTPAVAQSIPPASPAAQSADGASPTAAPPADASLATDDADAPAPGMALMVQDADGRPVPEAKIHFRSQVNGEWLERDVTTDVAGRARFEVKRGRKVNHLWLTCSKPGLVSVHYLWRAEEHPFELPTELALRMEPGTPVSGIVLDENGEPINGADITVHLPITWPKLANYVFFAANLKTNAQGRWHWDSAPADLGDVGVAVTHANYLRGFGRFAERENRAVLSQGLKIAGRVRDERGKPLAGAAVRLGFDHFGSCDPESKTDRAGRFVLNNCKAGKSIVTVQADGFAPQFQDVTVAQEASDVDFRLEPGRVTRIRVVDAHGNPIRGACFCTDTWRGYRSLDVRIDTNAEGRAEWRSAPSDAVLCDILHSGHMAIRRLAIGTGPGETVVTLSDHLVIRGTVTDAETGWAIPRFGVRQGTIFENSDETLLVARRTNRLRGWTVSTGLRRTGPRPGVGVRRPGLSARPVAHVRIERGKADL